MKIEIIPVSPFETNCYLVWNEADKSCAVVDPGDEPERIISRIEKSKMLPKAILLTHGHADHIAAVEPIKKEFEIPIYIGRGDEILLNSPSANISALFGFHITCPPADHIVDDSDVLKIGSLEFTVIAVPGHSPGGVCYLTEDKLFCGDALFAGSIGRTDLPGGDYELLIDSINKGILTLPDNIACYPGHGPATTVGEERKSNPFLTGSRFA